MTSEWLRETPESTSRAETPPNVVDEREFVLEHTFAAPAAKVFAAYTDPKIVARWWDPRGGSITVEAMDLRPGGKWRYVQPMPNGQDIAYVGTYVEVQPPTRLIYTFGIEGQPGIEVTATVDLNESDGTTRLTLTNRCASKEARDAMVKYGAAAGAKRAWDRLAELLEGA